MEGADRRNGSAGSHVTSFFISTLTRVHMHSMKPTYTFGLGMILGFLFLIMVFTGVILMIYYTPSVNISLPVGEGYCLCCSRWTYYQEHAPLGFSGDGYRCLPAPVEGILYGLLPGKQIPELGDRSGVADRYPAEQFQWVLLPWDQLAYWAVTIGSNIAASARELTDLLGITNGFDPGGFLKNCLSAVKQWDNRHSPGFLPCM